MLKRIDHIELAVKGLEQTIAFYKRMGFREIMRTEHDGLAVELQLPGPDQPVFEMHEAKSDEQPGVTHIAYFVDDVQQSYEELKTEGVKFLREPHLNKVSGRALVNAVAPNGDKVQLVSGEREKPGGEGKVPLTKR